MYSVVVFVFAANINDGGATLVVVVVVVVVVDDDDDSDDDLLLPNWYCCSGPGISQRSFRFLCFAPDTCTYTTCYLSCRFTPEQLGITASSALVWLFVEIMVILFSMYICNVQAEIKTLDLLAFCGYKYFG